MITPVPSSPPELIVDRKFRTTTVVFLEQAGIKHHSKNMFCMIHDEVASSLVLNQLLARVGKFGWHGVS